jgi:ATPase family associated with various cellular activities (AAA)
MSDSPMIAADEDYNDNDLYNDDDPIYMSEAEETKIKSSLNKNVTLAKEKVSKSFLYQKVLFLRKKAGEFSNKYPNAIKHAITICEAAISFHKRKNPVTFIKGAFNMLSLIQDQNLNSFYQYARASDGFRYLTVRKTNVAFLFKDTLEKYPKEKVTFKNNETCDVYDVKELGCQVIYYSSGGTLYIYFNNKQIKADDLLNFLIDAKFKELNSNFLVLATKENEYDLTLSSWQPNVLPSKKAEKIGAMLKQFNDAGMNRSVFLYGVPGSGKTTCAFKILSDLNYRTIVFSASNKLVSFDMIKNIIEILKIEALIIDDFDQFSQTNKTLDMLELFNKKVKVLIGIANTIKEFNIAILRPGRFDLIYLIDELDENCIRSVLGKFSDRYLNKVKFWPVAFVNELAKQGQFLNQKEMDAYLLELEERVQYQQGGKKPSFMLGSAATSRLEEKSNAPSPPDDDLDDELIDAINNKSRELIMKTNKKQLAAFKKPKQSNLKKAAKKKRKTTK